MSKPTTGALDELRRDRLDLFRQVRDLDDVIERLEERERVARLTPAQRRREFRVIPGGRWAA